MKRITSIQGFSLLEVLLSLALIAGGTSLIGDAITAANQQRTHTQIANQLSKYLTTYLNHIEIANQIDQLETKQWLTNNALSAYFNSEPDCNALPLLPCINPKAYQICTANDFHQQAIQQLVCAIKSVSRSYILTEQSRSLVKGILQYQVTVSLPNSTCASSVTESIFSKQPWCIKQLTWLN